MSLISFFLKPCLLMFLLQRIYQCTGPYDPEGILGTLMSIFLCILGLQVTHPFLMFFKLDHHIRSSSIPLDAEFVLTAVTGFVPIAGYIYEVTTVDNMVFSSFCVQFKTFCVYSVWFISSYFLVDLCCSYNCSC